MVRILTIVLTWLLLQCGPNKARKDNGECSWTRPFHWEKCGKYNQTSVGQSWPLAAHRTNTRAWLSWVTQSSTEWSRTGTIWKISGGTYLMNYKLTLKIIRCSWQSHLSTLQQIEYRPPKSSSRHSVCLHFISKHNPCYLCMLVVWHREWC